MPGWMQSKFTRKNFQFSGEHTNRRTNDARNSHPPPSSSLLIGKNQTENQDTKNVKKKEGKPPPNRFPPPLSRVFHSIEPWNSQVADIGGDSLSNCALSPNSLSLSVFVQSQVRNAPDEVADGVLVHEGTPAPTRPRVARAAPCSHLV